MNYKDFIIDGTVIEKYHGTDRHVVVPEGITGLTDMAFEYSSIIETVELPSTVKNIDPWTFDGCDNLKNITVSDKNPYITKIDGCIYSKDKSKLIFYPPYIKDAVFAMPPFVKEIGWIAFCRSKMQKVICNTGLEIIGRAAFFCCNNLEEICLSDTVYDIRDWAFGTCENLKRVIFKNNARIHSTTFSGNSEFVEIQFCRGANT